MNSRVGGDVGVDDQHQGYVRYRRDGGEDLSRVELVVGEQCGRYRNGRTVVEQRVAIGGRVGDHFGGDVPARAGDDRNFSFQPLVHDLRSIC
ncbi:hypothetical protein D3C73_1489860 [compost metagenome]